MTKQEVINTVFISLPTTVWADETLCPGCGGPLVNGQCVRTLKTALIVFMVKGDIKGEKDALQTT